MSSIFRTFATGQSLMMVQHEAVPGQRFSGFSMLGRPRLSTESIGSFTLTLQNVVVGSIWEIETVTVQGVSVKSGVSASSNVTIALSVYGTGNSKNSLRIKVRNSSASPYYQAFETQTTAVVGSLSIFINQVRDDI